MGIMVYSLLWVMQDFVHQPKHLASANLPITANGSLRWAMLSSKGPVPESFIAP